MSLNIVILALKLANIWHFDPILEHLLHLGQKCVTMETRNLQYGITRTFPQVEANVACYRFCKNLKVYEIFQIY